MKTFKDFLNRPKPPTPDYIVVLWESGGMEGGRIFGKDDEYYVMEYYKDLKEKWTSTKEEHEEDPDGGERFIYKSILKMYHNEGKIINMSNDEFEEWFTLENI